MSYWDFLGGAASMHTPASRACRLTEFTFTPAERGDAPKFLRNHDALLIMAAYLSPHPYQPTIQLHLPRGIAFSLGHFHRRKPILETISILANCTCCTLYRRDVRSRRNRRA